MVQEVLERLNLDDKQNYIIFKNGKPIRQNILSEDLLDINVDSYFSPEDLCGVKRSAIEEEILSKSIFGIFLDIYKDIDIKLIHLNSRELNFALSIEIERELNANITNIFLSDNKSDANIVIDYNLNDDSNAIVNNFSNYDGKLNNYNNYYLDYRSKLEVNDLNVSDEDANSHNALYLYQEKAELSINNSIINTSGKNQIYNWQVFHKAKNTLSNMINYGVCKNNSLIDIKTNGLIEKGCSGVVVNQKSKGIMLDSTSVISTSPWLQIDEYDISAGHGSSIGSIDESDLFYLMSRGLSKEKSEELIVYGFFEPYLSKIKEPNLNSFIRGIIKNHLQ